MNLVVYSQYLCSLRCSYLPCSIHLIVILFIFFSIRLRYAYELTIIKKLSEENTYYFNGNSTVRPPRYEFVIRKFVVIVV